MWFTFSLLSALFMTLYFVLARLLLKDKGDPVTFTFIMILEGACVLLLLTPFEKTQFQVNWLFFAGYIGLALFFSIIDILFIKGRQLEDISTVSLFNQTGIIWAVIGGILLFNEHITLQKISGIGLILLGNIVVLWTGKKIAVSRGVTYILVGSFLFTLGSFFDKIYVQTYSPLLYKGILFFIEALLLFVFFFSNRISRIKNELKIQGKGIYFVGPVFALAIFFLNKAFQVGGEASKVVPVFNLSLILASTTGIIFLGERENMSRKFIALLIVIIGTYLLQIS